MKKTINDFRQMKKDNIPVSWLTSYNYWQGKTSQNAGIDLILCGDSYGNVECGYDSTIPVTLEQMIEVAKNVRRGANQTFLVGDFPMGCYESSNSQAVDSAVKFIKAGADAIKLERASHTILQRIQAISDVGILVFAHLGVTPQTALSLTGGYRCVGKTVESFEDVYNESLAVEKAGADFLLLEGMPELPAKQISKVLKIPVYGIGTGAQTDGCLMIFHDLLGLFPDFRPYFGKCFVENIYNDLLKNIFTHTEKELKDFGRKNPGQDGLFGLSELAIKKYVSDVKTRKFPDSLYTYPLKDEELNELRKSRYWNPSNE
jgi:3-methyl-2-oxobutanoate hydroxymethyltransferase